MKIKMDYGEKSLQLHSELKGKLDIVPKYPVCDKEGLSVIYTPGVARPCVEINKDYGKSFTLTGRGNLIAVITDGTAVLGLGDIGPEAGMPVMEGKCQLFKEFAGIDAIPICIRSKDVNEIVKTIKLISGSFGGINLEDISAPRCFEIEKMLKEDTSVDIPVMHDDQHGTAVVVLAGLINALRVTQKDKNAKVVINGAGSAGLSIAKLLIKYGISNITLCDKKGIVSSDEDWLNDEQKKISKVTNKDNLHGDLSVAIKGADVFIGVSAPNVLLPEMIKCMSDKPIVFAMANPLPEIMPDIAKKAGAYVVGTGRSDFPNQINNVLAFPGIFRGALDVRALDITDGMLIEASMAIAGVVKDGELSADYIIPSPFNKEVAKAVAKAVAKKAIEEKLARV